VERVSLNCKAGYLVSQLIMKFLQIILPLLQNQPRRRSSNVLYSTAHNSEGGKDAANGKGAWLGH